MPKRKKIFYGWWIVLAATLIHFTFGGTFYYGLTVFFNPIKKAFGWTAATTSIAFTLQRLEQGIMGPVVGVLVDRLGPRKLMIGGWTVAGLGFLWMSRINSLWTFYGAFLVIAIGMSFGSGTGSNTAIAHWFRKKRSRALAIINVGPGVSGLLVPLLALSISQVGWREVLAYVGIALWFIGIPLSLVMRHKPEQYGYLPDGESVVEPDSSTPTTGFTARAALRTRTFWLLSLVFFFQQLGLSAVFVHIVPYLESVGLPTTIAALSVTGITIFSLIGRLGCGLLGDFVNKRYLIAIALSLQTIGLFIFSLITVDRMWFLLASLLAFGSGYGGPIAVRPALQADYFGRRSYGTIMGLAAVVSTPAGLVSPILTGWMFDILGSYHLAWQLFALVTLPAIPLMLLAKPPLAKPASNFT